MKLNKKVISLILVGIMIFVAVGCRKEYEVTNKVYYEMGSSIVDVDINKDNEDTVDKLVYLLAYLLALSSTDFKIFLTDNTSKELYIVDKDYNKNNEFSDAQYGLLDSIIWKLRLEESISDGNTKIAYNNLIVYLKDIQEHYDGDILTEKQVEELTELIDNLKIELYADGHKYI